MQVEIKIDHSYLEPKVVVYTSQMNEEIELLLKRISEEKEAPKILTGMQNEQLKVLDEVDIIRIEANAGKVLAHTSEGEYVMRQRLYELESRLEDFSFVRISNSEIINLKKVKNFDLSFAGTICVSMIDGSVLYASRRYVARVKNVLGI